MKGKLQESIRRYNKWLRHEKNYHEWEYDYKLDSSGGNYQPQDLLSREKRKKIRQAVLTIGEIPSPVIYAPRNGTGGSLTWVTWSTSPETPSTTVTGRRQRAGRSHRW